MKKVALKSLIIGASLFAVSSPLYANTVQQTQTVTYNANVANVLDSLAEKIREYQQQNPNATEAELNSYAESLLASEVSQKPIIEERSGGSNSYELDSYVTGRLNDEEKKLYNAHKAKALLCMSNGKIAIAVTEQRYSSGLHNGNGDAFRHALWNFGMARDVGADFAKKWSDAHEYGAKRQPKIEQSMDLYNNNIGLNLAKSSKARTISGMADAVQKEVKAGKMRIIVNGRLAPSNANGEKK